MTRGGERHVFCAFWRFWEPFHRKPPGGGSPPPPRVWLSLPLVAEQGRSNCEANISSIVCPYVHYERPNLRHLDMSFCTATYCTCPGFHQERLFVCCGYNESYNEKWGKTATQSFSGLGSRCLKAMMSQTSQVGGEICPNSPQINHPNLQKVTQNGTKIDQNGGLRPPKRR